MSYARALRLVVVFAVTIAAYACASSQPSRSSETHDDSGTDSGTGLAFGDGATGLGSADASGPSGCVNLECQVHACGTTLTGQVFDPAGRNPLYNVGVYIPNSKDGQLQPIPLGINSASCSCDTLVSGEPLVAALTDGLGTFTLTNVPDGENIPVVVQIGKWRKEIIVPKITQCTTNSAGKITLPKNLTDGAYASLPNIAVSTGNADTLECMLTRVGIDKALFTANPTGPGVHVFQGEGGNATAGGSLSSPTSLWDNPSDLMRYDITMLSCEGDETTGVSAATATTMAAYVNAGGRVFAEHFHYSFFESGTVNAPAPVAYPEFANVASWYKDDEYGFPILGVIQTTLPSGAAFPEGAALKYWLGNIGALTANTGEITIPKATARASAIVTSSNLATPWVQTAPGVIPPSTQYFSWDMPFNAPVNDAGVPQHCGRVVYSDMHVSGSAPDYQLGSTKIVPDDCASTYPLSPDEDAIEFILFNLSSCITPVGYTPQPPGVPK